MINIKTLMFLFASLMIMGCSTTVKLNTYISNPDAVNKDVYISHEDLSNVYSSVGNLAEAMFPINIEIGEGLRDYSRIHLSPVKVLNPASTNLKGIYIKLNEFKINTIRHFPAATTYYAELSLDVTVKDGKGNTVLSKTYTGKGGEQTYSNANSVLAAGTTATSSYAFNNAFREIAEDIKKLQLF